jgi:hypothetical protein
MDGLYRDALRAILRVCTSKTRAILTSVSHKLNEESVLVSRSISATPQYYENTNDINYSLCEFTRANIKLICKSGDYHLIVRLKNRYLLSYIPACSSGCLDLIELITKKTDCVEYYNSGIYTVYKNNHTQVIDSWAMQPKDDYWCIEAFLGACAGGHEKLISMAMLSSIDFIQTGLRTASKHNQTHIIKLLDPINKQNNQVFLGLCAGGHIDSIKNMLGENIDNINGGLLRALSHNHFNVVDLLVSRGAVLDYVIKPVVSKHLNVIKYLIDNDMTSSNNALIANCCNSRCDLSVIKLLLPFGVDDLISLISISYTNNNSNNLISTSYYNNSNKITKYLYRHIMGLIFNIYPAEEYSDAYGNTMPNFRQTPRTSRYDDTDYFKDGMLLIDYVDGLMKYIGILNYDRYGELTQF